MGFLSMSQNKWYTEKGALIYRQPCFKSGMKIFLFYRDLKYNKLDISKPIILSIKASQIHFLLCPKGLSKECFDDEKVCQSCVCLHVCMTFELFSYFMCVLVGNQLPNITFQCQPLFTFSPRLVACFSCGKGNKLHLYNTVWVEESMLCVYICTGCGLGRRQISLFGLKLKKLGNPCSRVQELSSNCNS